MARVGIERRAAIALAILVAVSASAGCNRISARRSLKVGNNAYKENRWAKALEAYAQVPEDVPERLHAELGIAYTHMAQFRPGSTRPENTTHVDEGVKAFANYLKRLPADNRDPNLPDHDKIEGWIIEMLVGAERYSDAITRMGEDLKAKPGDPVLLRGIASAYEKWGKLVEAVKYYREWADKFPRDPAPHVATAAFCWNISYRRAAGLEPIERNRWVDIGMAAVDDALRINPDHFESLTYQNLLLRERAKMRLDPDVIAGHMQQANEILAKVTEMRKKMKEAEAAEKAKATASPAPAKTGGAS